MCIAPDMNDPVHEFSYVRRQICFIKVHSFCFGHLEGLFNLNHDGFNDVISIIANTSRAF